MPDAPRSGILAGQQTHLPLRATHPPTPGTRLRRIGETLNGNPVIRVLRNDAGRDPTAYPSKAQPVKTVRRFPIETTRS
jgi:hypothetical protein